MKSQPEGIDVRVIRLPTAIIKKMVEQCRFNRLSNYLNPEPTWVKWQEPDELETYFENREV